MRKFFIFAGIGMFFVLVTACLSMNWVAEPKQPTIPELKSVENFGVASFKITTSGNNYPLLVKMAGNDEYNPITIQGASNKIAIWLTGSTWMKASTVTKADFADQVRKSWYHLISREDNFDYPVSKGFSFYRVMGQSLEGEPIGNGYKKVVSIEDTVDFDTDPGIIKGLGEKYGVDVILGGTAVIMCDIGRVTNQYADEIVVEPLTVNSYIADIGVEYEWVLYDTKTGKVIGDNMKYDSPFDAMQPYGNDIIRLDAKSKEEVKRKYLDSPKNMVSIFATYMEKEAAFYLPLFRDCYLAHTE